MLKIGMLGEFLEIASQAFLGQTANMSKGKGLVNQKVWECTQYESYIMCFSPTFCDKNYD